jgi:hypothetical protein
MSVADTAELSFVFSWQSAGNSFAGTGFAGSWIKCMVLMGSLDYDSRPSGGVINVNKHICIE